MVSITGEKLLEQVLAVGAFLVTVTVVTSGVTDPVNVTKLFLLGGQAGSILLLLTIKFRQRVWADSKFLLCTLSTFLLFGVSSSLFSAAPFSQNFYGVAGRNTGLLTYFFLAIILLAASIFTTTKPYKTIISAFLAAGIVNVLYCGWVILFGDFVEWNNPYGNILGTFGNPNFIGSFLGMFFSAIFTLLLSPNIRIRERVILIFTLVMTAIEIDHSSAVQGKVVAVGGASIALLFWIRSQSFRNIIQFPYLITLGLLGAFAIAGALQRGPLTQLIYKTSVSLRGEYWAAGFRMGIDYPYTGVGMDTYGDWYRRFRDEQALITPGPNTVTNAAHNVLIDLFANGGAPLLTSYLVLMIFAIRAIIKFSKRTESFDPIFVCLVVTWLGYQAQALISINQIGLAIWGWLLTGALIGYEKVTRVAIVEVSHNREKAKSRLTQFKNTSSQEVLSPKLLAGIGLVIGLIISVPPLSSDLAWTKAVRSQNFGEVEKALERKYLTPLNSIKLAQITQMLEQSKLYDEAHKYALRGVEFNPDYFDGWKFLYLTNRATEDEKKIALANMRRLDPLNPDPLN